MRPIRVGDQVRCKVPEGRMLADLYIVSFATEPRETGYQELSVLARNGAEYRAGAWQFELVDGEDEDLVAAKMEKALEELGTVIEEFEDALKKAGG